MRVKVKHADGSYCNWYRVADGHRFGWQAKKPCRYIDVPYVGAIDPFDPELAGELVFWTEGERDTDTLANINLPAFTFGGCGDGLPEGAASYVAGRHIIILIDNDDAGREHGEKKAALCSPIAASVRVLDIAELPARGDVTDFVEAGGTHDDLMRLAGEAPPWTPPADPQPSSQPESGGLIVHRAPEITPTKIEWLWPDRIARGKHTTIAGDPATGKSQVTISIAAAVTTGGDWPCKEGQAPIGDVVLLSAEDDPADTIVPRLIAAGADVDRVHIITATHAEDGKTRRPVNLQADIDKLKLLIEKIATVALVIIDPISAYMGQTDSHKNADVRAVLAPISDMAEQTRVAVLSVTHLSKGGNGGSGNPLYRFIGSIAFTAAPRAAFLVTKDPEDNSRCLFLHGKNNLAAPPRGLAYRVEQLMIGKHKDILGSRVAWELDPVDITADQAFGAQSANLTATDDAVDLLSTLLANGPMQVKEIEAEGRAACLLGEGQPISQSKPFRLARDKLGIKPYQPKGQKSGGWFWALPDHMPWEAADALS
jgi:hypothetical protein